jgi:sugar/nucleoside kinase (ribokinase family)
VSILVVGSVAFDSIQTPFGNAPKTIGGAATYFSVAASYFTPVRLVGVVGEDFGEDEMSVFRGRPIDTAGLTRVEGGKTFHWSGKYGYDLNVAHTLDTQLNVFAEFSPQLPEQFRDSEYVFLANIDPDLQETVLDQVTSPKLVALDTMNFWIESKKDSLERVMRKVDLVVINEGEVRQFTGEPNLVVGGRKLLDLGPRWIVIKRGEYGVIMMTSDHIFAAPAYPLEAVFDPTGAGDSFAGGMIGYLARQGSLDNRSLRQAIIFGSVVASFTVEKFSLDRLREISRDDLESRYREFRSLTEFEDFG